MLCTYEASPSWLRTRWLSAYAPPRRKKIRPGRILSPDQGEATHSFWTLPSTFLQLELILSSLYVNDTFYILTRWRGKPERRILLQSTATSCLRKYADSSYAIGSSVGQTGAKGNRRCRLQMSLGCSDKSSYCAPQSLASTACMTTLQPEKIYRLVTARLPSN